MSAGGFFWGGLRTSFVALALAALGRSALAENFTVNSSADDGSAGTMRWAIE